MRVVLFFTNNLAEPENIFFDLHFREPTYTILHKIHFQNPSTELIKLLSIELPSSDMLSGNSNSNSNNTHNTATAAGKSATINNHDHNIKKRRTTSPSLSNSTKKIKTPPSMSSPAQFSDGPLTPSSIYYNKYPSSPAMLQQKNTDHDFFLNTSMESDILFRAIHGYRQDRKDGSIIDDVYEEKDVDNINPIHGKNIEENVRIAWGLPEGLDMLELAKRLSNRTTEQTEEIETLIKNYKRDGINVEENDGKVLLDSTIYSYLVEILKYIY
jgi:hypothetical protein